MPTKTPQAAPVLEDYLDLFQSLADLGVEFVVIGGCAVGAYARLIGETVISNDLDLLVTERALETFVADSAGIGARIEKMPSPRAVPVAVVSWRAHEINLLTGSVGMAPADVEARSAREFPLNRGTHSTIVLIADPYDLLRNKLAVNRLKDQPHRSQIDLGPVWERAPVPNQPWTPGKEKRRARRNGSSAPLECRTAPVS